MTTDNESWFPVPRDLLGGDGTLFLLKMPDDSMAAAGFSAGDWVVVRQQQNGEDGELVAVMLYGDATVRTLRRIRSGTLLLESSYASSGPHTVPELAGEATILGKVTAIIRRT